MTNKDEALQMALELAERFLEYDGISSSDYIDLSRACKEALEQPAQEPVACHWVEKGKGHCERNNRMGLPDSYTHPHQWQGLTDDDILNLVPSIEEFKPEYGIMLSNEWNILDFAVAIEQALKDKNT